MNRKIIVLDDDPTGIQTVHDVLVITKAEDGPIKEAFEREDKLFYILTNSRSFSEAETIRYHKELCERILRIAKETGQEFMLVSRGDSTLRGHYPLENEVMKEVLEAHGLHIDGEIICPYLDGIRKTIEDVHYVLRGEEWIPCGESEFSKDKSFGYTSSNLKEYVEEKTKGRYLAKDCISITLQELKQRDEAHILQKLTQVKDFQKVIVNADCMEDLEVFVEILEKAADKRFLFRCAASLVKCLGHITSQPLLTRAQCIDTLGGKGGCILVGSHVQKTASQLSYLKEHAKQLVWITFDQHKIKDGTLHEESLRVSACLDEEIAKGKIVVVATRRERIDFPSDDPIKQLEWATTISKELIGVLANMKQRPGFLITKGGITSSDALTLGLHVEKEWVLGQIHPMVGVVRCMEESKFPGLPVVVFPGNVGDETSLYQVVHMLRSEES